VGQYSILELSDLRRVAKRLLEQLAADYGTAAKPALECSARHARQVRQACGCHEQPAAAQPLVDLAQFRNAIRDDLRDVWLPRYDLLDSGPDDAHFVVEMSDERQAMLRFGQRGFGRAPDLAADAGDAEMLADYRTGNGTAGNVPAESIRRFGSYGSPYPEILSVRNPLAAVGGVDAESATEVRLFAPHAIRTQLQRAVTAGDYERIAMREFGGELQRVKATLLWTGHEFEVLVAVDPRGGEVAGHELLDAIRATLHRYRRIGHAVRVRAAERVVPTLALTVCVGRHVIKEQVRNDLDRLFSNQVFPDGSLAFFHPDRLTFGDGIYVSQIVAAAARVPGVVHVEVTALHRSDEGPATELEDGVLPLRPQEIVRFDNDRSRPEFGTLRRPIKGGR
jgi:predicted phage baseplate assembly protein